MITRTLQSAVLGLFTAASSGVGLALYTEVAVAGMRDMKQIQEMLKNMQVPAQ